MRSVNRGFLLVAVVSAMSFAHMAQAGDCSCAHCGGCCACQKVCRLVCEEKKVDVVCWGCICEDFCLPKHNKPGCEHCKWVCAKCDEPCDPNAPHVVPKRFVWTEWIPGCATMHTKKKLMKKTESVKVPSFKWVVEDLCPACEASCQFAEAGPDDAVPAPPAVAEAKLLYGRK